VQPVLDAPVGARGSGEDPGVELGGGDMVAALARDLSVSLDAGQTIDNPCCTRLSPCLRYKP
jgi:hypothetical protein